MDASVSGPAYRSHTALKFAAGVARVFAVLIVAGTSVGAVASLVGISGARVSPTSLPGVPLTVGVPGAVAVLFLVLGLIYAVLFWAAADALVMLADGDDAHRSTQFQLAQLSTQLAALRDVRNGTASTDVTERLFPPS